MRVVAGVGALQIHYRIEGSGGVESKPMTIIDQTSTLPGCTADKGDAQNKVNQLVGHPRSTRR
jgi:hypothetical protein